MSAKISEQHFQRQLRIFKNFVNVHLKKFHRSIESLSELSTGIELFYLLKSLIEENEKEFSDFKKMEVKRLNMAFVQKSNCQVILKWMREKDSIPLHGITAQSITEKDQKIIMGLVWNIILAYHVQGNKKSSKQGPQEGVYEELIKWVNSILEKKYSQFLVSPTNLQDWESGDALFYLQKELYEMYSNSPEKALKFPKDNELECLNECICFGRDEMNIPPILIGEDFKNPDKLTLTTYLSFYRNYEQMKKKEKVKEEKLRLYEKLKELSEKKNDNNDLLEKIKFLEEKLDLCQKKIQDLEFDKKRLEKELLERKEIENDKNKKIIKDYETRIFEKEKIVKELQENLALSVKKVEEDKKKVLEEIERKKNSLELLKGEEKKNKIVTEVLKSKIDELQSLNESIRGKFKNISKTLEDKEKEIENCKAEHIREKNYLREKLKKALEESDKKVTELTKNFIEMHKKNNEEKTRQLEVESKKMSNISMETEILKKKNERLKNIITEMTVNKKKEDQEKMGLLRKKVEEIALLKKQNQVFLNFQKDFNKQKKAFEDKEEQYKKSILTLNKTKRKCLEKIESSNKLVDHMKHQVTALKQMVKEKDDEVHKIKRMKKMKERETAKEKKETDDWQKSSMGLLNKFADKYKFLQKGGLNNDQLLSMIQKILFEQEREHKKEINNLNDQLSVQTIEINGYKEAFKKKFRELENKHNQEMSKQVATYLEKIDTLKMKKDKLARYIKDQMNNQASENLIKSSKKGDKKGKKEISKLQKENLLLKQKLVKAEMLSKDRLQIIKALENNYPSKFK